ncbi:TlpA family protein disulfide reductase [Pedobacter nyackensis]|uniref:Thioredoxin-like n=1 Tax=Pedobacter nyackensis TaxID=475255 RepID=A0A1W2A7H6_9SPHI|nr:TlpA disulfide reductase family protein [Pedobacter nyackensis]SMC56533.1 Thioredoxin-like [Pedobacter nyackensis]
MKTKFLYLLALMLLSSILSVAQAGTKTNLISDDADNFITITIQTDHQLSWNTLTLSYWSSLMDYDYISYQVKAHRTKDNQFNFKIPVSDNNKLGYVSIVNEEPPETQFQRFVLSYYLVEKGDRVRLLMKSDSPDGKQKEIQQNQLVYVFSGAGSEKYTFRKEMENIDSDSPADIIAANYEYNVENKFDKVLTEQMRLLESYRSKIGDQAYWVLKADLIGGNEANKLSFISTTLRGGGGLDSAKIKYVYEKYLTNSPGQNLPLFAKGSSMNYCNFLFDYERLFYQLRKKSRRINYGYEFYDLIKRKYTGTLRDKLIAMLCVNNYARLSENKSVVDDALKTVEHPDLLLILNKLASKNKAVLAYNFKLPDKNGSLVSLAQFKGKVVFMDYWFTGCSGCTNYYKNVLKAVEKHYENSKDVVFISISSDVKRAEWMSSIKQNLYTSPNAINLFTAGKGMDHPVIKEYNIRSGPTPMLISREGKMISYKGPELYNKESLIKAIEAAKSNL